MPQPMKCYCNRAHFIPKLHAFSRECNPATAPASLWINFVTKNSLRFPQSLLRRYADKKFMAFRDGLVAGQVPRPLDQLSLIAACSAKLVLTRKNAGS